MSNPASERPDPPGEPPSPEEFESPIELFEQWFAAARAAGVDEPEAVCLATASADGAPSARMVLFRGIEDGCPTFFTNYSSRKGRELAENPRAALVFYWKPLDRQVRIEGPVARLSPELSDRYFASRSRASRISAWTSRQSEPIESRAALEARRAETEHRFSQGEVPRPEFWGGYALRPLRFEFWVGRPHRFHDRFAFLATGRSWERARLQP